MPCPLGTGAAFIKQKRECRQGLEGGDFRPQEENTTRPLTEWSDTLTRKGQGASLSLCLTASAGFGAEPRSRVERRMLGHCRGGNPGWGEHWERSDLCEGQSPLGVEGT